MDFKISSIFFSFFVGVKNCKKGQNMIAESYGTPVDGRINLLNNAEACRVTVYLL